MAPLLMEPGPWKAITGFVGNMLIEDCHQIGQEYVMLGTLGPCSFYYPKHRNKLGIKVYDNLIRERWFVDSMLAARSSQTWGAQEWPPERIVQHYGPATWNPNELVSGAREPIYNLNRIIRLQAVLEILTNQTAAALNLLADQSTQMRNAIYQHHIVLDYLLAEEGEVYGKLNESNCCLQINDNGKVARQLTKEMRKLAHVPVQTWGGWNMHWLTSWLPQLEWLRKGFLLFALFIVALSALACFAPCLVALIRRMVNQVAYQQIKLKTGDPRALKMLLRGENLVRAKGQLFAYSSEESCGTL